jgi:hypothetical protein
MSHDLHVPREKWIRAQNRRHLAVGEVYVYHFQDDPDREGLLLRFAFE